MRARELANDADLRLTAPRDESPRVTKRVAASGDNRLPAPGTVLTRQYKGRNLEVTVQPDGFEFEGSQYKSLSAVAKAATGAHWNGFHFFGLRK